MTRATSGILSIAGILVTLGGIAFAQQARMKMTTDIPESITTPDKVETRIGTLEFFDGFPTEETARKCFDNLDLQRGVEANPDGSYDIYFGPEAPEGRESNWIQTVPGKGFNVILRFYGPLEPWFDQTWRPGEIVTVD